LIQTNLSSGFNTIIDNKQYWLEWIGNNIWVDFFSKNQIYIKDGWIDFESEIATIIKSLDEDMTESDGKRLPLHSKMRNLSNRFLAEYFSAYSFASQFIDSSNKSITYKEIRDRLFDDLNKLIRTLEFYLIEYVGKIDIEAESSDIKGINPDKVLSFNFTDTYNKLYGKDKQIEYDFIHGKADQYHSAEDNRLVLGIDEYLPDERRNVDIDFIAFKKFYQRIHKETGCLYQDWVGEIQEEYFDYLERQEEAKGRLHVYPGDSIKSMINNMAVLAVKKVVGMKAHNLYIYGHSLDVTDKDILKDLILNANVQTTIFYYNKEVHGQQIANLVKVIGQEELLKRTGGPTKTITFKQQGLSTQW
jgi:hypothetical protein